MLFVIGICYSPEQYWGEGACKFAETCFFFQGEQKNLVFSTYLYTQNLICLLQCFLCFVLPMSRNYSFSVCFCSKQQITIALVLSSGQPNVCFLFRPLPPCYIVLTRSLSLPPSAPCYLWDKTAVVQRSSLEVNSAGSQAAQSLPRVWQEAFCHLCRATSPTHHPALSSNPINASIWEWSDDLMCWR